MGVQLQLQLLLLQILLTLLLRRLLLQILRRLLLQTQTRRCCSGCSRRGSRHDTRVCMGRLQERRAIIVGKSTKLWYTNLKVFFCIAVGVKRNQFKHKENTPKI